MIYDIISWIVNVFRQEFALIGALLFVLGFTLFGANALLQLVEFGNPWYLVIFLFGCVLAVICLWHPARYFFRNKP